MRYTNASYKIEDKEGLITKCMIYSFVENEYQDDESFIARQLFSLRVRHVCEKIELKVTSMCYQRHIACKKVVRPILN